MHRELAVLDLPGGAGVLPLHADGPGAFLQIAGLVDQQHAVGMPELGGHEIPHVGADQCVVPARPADQVLHAARAVVAGVFGDRPAVLDR